MAERAYTRFEVSIGSRYSWTTFPNLSTTGLQNSLREGKWGCRVFPTFQFLAEFRQVCADEEEGGRGRLHRWESMRIKTLDFYPLEDERQSPRYLYCWWGMVSRFSRRKKNCSVGNGQFREYRDYALSRVLPRGFALADRRDREGGE